MFQGYYSRSSVLGHRSAPERLIYGSKFVEPYNSVRDPVETGNWSLFNGEYRRRKTEGARIVNVREGGIGLVYQIFVEDWEL
jgi:hypothetical protein